MLPSTINGWLLCLLFANLVTTGAVVLFQQGAFIIGGEKASILSSVEPATSVIVGAIVFTKEFRKFKQKIQLENEEDTTLKTAI